MQYTFLFTFVFCAGVCLAAENVVQSKPTKASSLIVVSEDDWEMLNTGEWMVEFHAPWCPACRQLQPEWKKFSSWASDLGIKVGAVDVTSNPGLSGRFMVTALPTIYHVKDGNYRQYKGSRDTDSFVSFVEDKKWQSTEPISSWKSPNSAVMTVVSSFFKISMALRSVHNFLVEDYGIPYWGSYVLFGLTTIMIGAILGLIIVCVIDVVFPAKMSEEHYRELRNAKKDDPDDDIIENDDETSHDESKSSANEATDDDKSKAAVRKRRTRRAQ